MSGIPGPGNGHRTLFSGFRLWASETPEAFLPEGSTRLRVLAGRRGVTSATASAPVFLRLPCIATPRFSGDVYCPWDGNSTPAGCGCQEVTPYIVSQSNYCADAHWLDRFSTASAPVGIGRFSSRGQRAMPREICGALRGLNHFLLRTATEAAPLQIVENGRAFLDHPDEGVRAR
jgi:hypothetical protein